MEDKELHPVVELLLARMKSHPEEFETATNRWDWVLHRVQDNGSEAELEALNDGLRLIRLSEAHDWMLDELCNGEERRRKEEEDRAYERKMMAQQVQRPMIPLTNQYANVAQLGHPGQFITDYDHATQNLIIKDTHTKQITSIPGDSGMVATIKKALGI